MSRVIYKFLVGDIVTIWLKRIDKRKCRIVKVHLTPRQDYIFKCVVRYELEDIKTGENLGKFNDSVLYRYNKG